MDGAASFLQDLGAMKLCPPAPPSRERGLHISISEARAALGLDPAVPSRPDLDRTAARRRMADLLHDSERPARDHRPSWEPVCMQRI